MLFCLLLLGLHVSAPNSLVKVQLCVLSCCSWILMQQIGKVSLACSVSAECCYRLGCCSAMVILLLDLYALYPFCSSATWVQPLQKPSAACAFIPWVSRLADGMDKKSLPLSKLSNNTSTSNHILLITSWSHFHKIPASIAKHHRYFWALWLVSERSLCATSPERIFQEITHLSLPPSFQFATALLIQAFVATKIKHRQILMFDRDWS